MKKSGVLLLMFLVLSGISFAQERGGGERPSKTMEQGNKGDRPQVTPEQRIQRQTQRLVEELKLTKDQEEKVLSINKKYMEKLSGDWSKMRDANDAERVKIRAEMQKVQLEKDKEIKVLLTPEQVKLYDENQKKREEMRKSGQGRGGQGK